MIKETSTSKHHQKGQQQVTSSSGSSAASSTSKPTTSTTTTTLTNGGYVVLGIVAVLSSLFFYPLLFKYFDFTGMQSNRVEVSSIQGGLKKISHWSKNNGVCSHRIAVGYNTNLDLVVDAIELMQMLGVITSESPLSADSIDSIDDFENTFTYYFKTGSAAERTINDKKLFDVILNAALSLKRKEFHTGGNAGIIANRLAKEGCNVYLSGVVGERLKQLLHERINVIDYNRDTQDEIHLIMEYQRNESWGQHVTPRANRFIVSRDESNANMATLEVLHHHLKASSGTERTDLLILSGLHLLDVAHANRIDDMAKVLEETPHSTSSMPIHLELASMTSVPIIKDIASKIIPNVDSVGLNEQELGFLYINTGGSQHKLADFSSPSINTAVDAIIHLFNNVGGHRSDLMDIDIDGGKKTLSRVHFHYLTYHIVAVKKDMWPKERSMMSVAASSLEASDQACGFKDVELRIPLKFEVDYRYTPGSKLKFNIDETFPVVTWQDEGIEFHLAPVLVCKAPSKTVGLGDSISTTGFIYQTLKS
ncbi:hypothetical protein SAMD00019534_113050 [Acytostelium subglobosum LB1]|uniref:hypothetical protein n=1 Tax=Acytostelium subglobosum LB1 TaxID=1410327 RepID=UPI0006447F64|nr:hypothetical protein SAMD00019534_113050 [Acytostelium subglobosum LB1]GAM28129.1 hypothetical protein SAMD00019534_113050 [Acytostelium subglobosum LB1]|eukprot:XP_012748763.1 hypothetical protein SAMD00019534_113050 [Acytostelium subglobosum LB1]